MPNNSYFEKYSYQKRNRTWMLIQKQVERQSFTKNCPRRLLSQNSTQPLKQPFSPSLDLAFCSASRGLSPPVSVWRQPAILSPSSFPKISPCIFPQFSACLPPVGSSFLPPFISLCTMAETSAVCFALSAPSISRCRQVSSSLSAFYPSRIHGTPSFRHLSSAPFRVAVKASSNSGGLFRNEDDQFPYGSYPWEHHSAHLDSGIISLISPSLSVN